MSDFKEISQMLVSSGGAQVVRDSDNIYDAVNKFLNDKRKAQKAGALAEVVFAENKGAVNKTLSVIERLLPKE
jgi:3-deoxy-D-manno-octulosonic-acid transferase